MHREGYVAEGSDSDVVDPVLRLLADYGIDNARPEMSLRECGLDSLEIVALIQDLEALCQIEIPDDEAQNLRTVGDLIRVATP